ncbi:MAG: CBS domain-containing protein [Gammaproteobacteria bacterium]|nr:CBS domain-containing protein [Gammaproteobacteria bacterium]
MTLEDLLHNKDNTLMSVKVSDEVNHAIKTMVEHSIGSLLIMSEEDQLVGILTERDVLRFGSSRNGDLSGALIEEVMTRDLMVATPDCSIDQAMSMMTEHRFRHLPVIEDGKPVGMVSIGDLVKAKLKDVTVEVKYLRDYISA